MKDRISIDCKEVDVHDVMNPPGMFIEGKRQREWARRDLLPLSGKLIPEFDRRRNIGDMFARKPSLPTSQSTVVSSTALEDAPSAGRETGMVFEKDMPAPSPTKIEDSGAVAISTSSSPAGRKRSTADFSTNKPIKRAKSGSAANTPPTATKGQQSLKGFFKSTAVPALGAAGDATKSQAAPPSLEKHVSDPNLPPAVNLAPTTRSDLEEEFTTSFTDDPSRTTPSNSQIDGSNSVDASSSINGVGARGDNDMVHDPIESKESWTKLFTKPAAPRCEGHNEPCISLLTKKSGMNNGRSFWMCPRPIGPSGAKEKNTQWRCQTFIWCSDWNPNSA